MHEGKGQERTCTRTTQRGGREEGQRWQLGVGACVPSARPGRGNKVVAFIVTLACWLTEHHGCGVDLAPVLLDHHRGEGRDVVGAEHRLPGHRDRLAAEAIRAAGAILRPLGGTFGNQKVRVAREV